MGSLIFDPASPESRAMDWVTSSRPYGTFRWHSRPRTASWAKFSRPFGTRFVGPFSRRLFRSHRHY
jgi:hypothetical protein